MKKLLFIAILFASCKKEGTSFECVCSNGYTRNMNKEYKISEKQCADKQKEINDTASVKVSCKLK